MRYLISIYLVITLSGCAVVSVSQHQGAEPLGEGAVRITGGIGLGRDMAEGTIYAPDQDEDSDFSYGFPLFEAGIGVGITETIDLGGMLWTSIGSAGLRTYGKFSFHSPPSKTYYAFAPAIVYNQTDEYNYRLIGVEVPLLVSYRATSTVAFYGSGRVHLYTMSIDDPSLTDGRESFFLAMPGITTGIQLGPQGLKLTPEVSTFFIYDRIRESGSIRFFPNIGLSIRF